MNTGYFVDSTGVIYSIYDDGETNFPLFGGSLQVTDSSGATIVICSTQEPYSVLTSVDNNTVYVLGPAVDGAAEVLAEYQLWTSLLDIFNAIEAALKNQVPK